MLGLLHPIYLRTRRCGWPSISEILVPSAATFVLCCGCGWPSISEMLGRAPRSSPIAAGCGWHSLSEMLSTDCRYGYGLCGRGWTSISDIVRERVVYDKRLSRGVYLDSRCMNPHTIYTTN